MFPHADLLRSPAKLTHSGHDGIEDNVEIPAMLHRRQISIGRAVPDSSLARQLGSGKTWPVQWSH